MKQKHICIGLCMLLIISVTGCAVSQKNVSNVEKDMLISLTDEIVQEVENDIGSLDKVEEIISRKVINGNGYVFLLDYQFKVLIHPKLQKGVYLGDDGMYKSIIEKMKNSKQEAIKYKLDGVTKVVVMTRLSNGDILVLYSDIKS